MMDFELHPRLRQDCLDVGCFALSTLLLMNDRQYPWFILVPRWAGISEIYQLPEDDRLQLMRESCALSDALAAVYRPDKLNVAAIGNLVPQLHVHHVARYKTDIAWPAPIWGKFDPLPYDETDARAHIERLRHRLEGWLID